MGNMFADIVGFVATLLGGFAFRDELANAHNVVSQQLLKTWNKARLWYMHTVAAGAWWMLTLVGVLLVVANAAVYALASNYAIGNDGLWNGVQAGVALVTFLPIAVCWVWLLPAKRIRDWSWINQQIEELKQLGEHLEERESVGAPATELDAIRGQIETLAVDFDKEFEKRYGKPRGPMLAVLVMIFAPIATAIGFGVMTAVLATRNGVEFTQTVQIALIGVACYVLGEVMLRLFSGLLESVLGDAGDAVNRIANAVLIRPGLLVMPFITEQNYEKIMPKPVEVPFKKAADAVKGTTFSIREIVLTFLGWTIILPAIAILGVVLIAGIMSYVIVTFCEGRKIDSKAFVEGSSKLHKWFMIAVMFFRIVQLVILGLWHQWWSGEMLWNPIALWGNSLLDEGGFNWFTVGLVIFGSSFSFFFADKMKDMKHPVMVSAFRGLTAFFGLLALLPLIGWGLNLGGIAPRLPEMPSGVEIAHAAEAEDAETETSPTSSSEEARAPDSIDRLTGTGTVATSTTITSPTITVTATGLPVLPVTGSLPPIPGVPPQHVEAVRSPERAGVDRCESIRTATGLTDLFREAQLRRFGC